MKSHLKLGLITLPLIAAGAGILAYMIATSPPPERKVLTERATAVRAIVTRNAPVVPTVKGFGLASPAHTFDAITQVGGIVEYVNPDLEKGAILPAGSVLLRLSPVDFDLAIAQASANIRAIEAVLAELAITEENQTAALAIEAEALVLKAQELNRIETLFTGGTVSQSTLDSARTAHLTQRQKVLAIKSTLALLPTQREVQLQQIAVQQANLETARLNLARTELTLPFPARVSAVAVETGQYLSIGKTAAELDGIAIAEVVTQIPVGAMRDILRSARPLSGSLATDPAMFSEILHGLDLKAEVRLQLGDEVVRWPATLDRISDTIDQKTGTVGVIVQVNTAYSSAEPGKRPPLAKGMFVEVALRAAPVSGIAVPRSALRDGQVMIADDDNRLLLVPVVPFLVQDGIALITEGLTEGQRVVVSDPVPAVSAMLLEVTEDMDLMARLTRESAE